MALYKIFIDLWSIGFLWRTFQNVSFFVVIHIILVKVSVLNQALTTSHGIMKGAGYYCEVLRQCFGEYLGQSRIAIAVPRGPQSRHETTTFLSPSDSTDLDLENEKPFTKKIFEPLMRIIELLKRETISLFWGSSSLFRGFLSLPLTGYVRWFVRPFTV